MLCASLFFFFKQKTAYEMRISDWSSDVCSSDLQCQRRQCLRFVQHHFAPHVRLSPSTVQMLPPSLAAGVSVVRRPTAERRSRWRPPADRSEERRVGKECVSTCRSRWSPYY